MCKKYVIIQESKFQPLFQKDEKEAQNLKNFLDSRILTLIRVGLLGVYFAVVMGV